VGLALEKVTDLRYGENPHQRGGLYRDVGGSGVLGGAEILQGKEMSFNNWLDAYAAGVNALMGSARALPVEFGPPFVDKPAHELLGDVLLSQDRRADQNARFLRSRCNRLRGTFALAFCSGNSRAE
jgi:hypothetical protein